MSSTVPPRITVDPTSGRLVVVTADQPSMVDKVATPLKHAWHRVEEAASPLREQLNNAPQQLDAANRSLMRRADQLGAILPNIYSPIANVLQLSPRGTSV